MSQTLSTTTAVIPQSARSPRPPSDRNLDIYKRAKLDGRHHWEIAQELGLDRSRVSQVVRRVTRWLAAGGDPIDPLVRDHFARQRLAQGNHKLRLHRAIQLAFDALQFRFPLETTKKRFQGTTEVWREEISRDVPRVSLSAIRLLLDATKSLQQLENDTDHKRLRKTVDSSDAGLDEQDLLCAVFDFLCGCRARAQAHSRLPLADNIPAENIPALISDTLTNLVGLPK